MNTYVSGWLAQAFQNEWKCFIVQWLALLLLSFANCECCFWDCNFALDMLSVVMKDL